MKVLLVAIAMAATAPATEFAWQCNVEKRFQCGSKGGGCAPLAVTMSAFIYPGESLYWRCPVERKGWDLGACDRYLAAVSTSGAFKNIELPGRAAFARVGPNLSFTEVVTLADQVLVSHGTCAEAPPPIVRRLP